MSEMNKADLQKLADYEREVVQKNREMRLAEYVTQGFKFVPTEDVLAAMSDTGIQSVLSTEGTAQLETLNPVTQTLQDTIRFLGTVPGEEAARLSRSLSDIVDGTL